MMQRLRHTGETRRVMYVHGLPRGRLPNRVTNLRGV